MAGNPPGADGSARSGRDRITVNELGRIVGMSPRNIRAHQARGLLDPPQRHGRVAYYHAGHVRRLEAIKALQRRGFNLVAVAAMLGVQGGEPATEALATTVQRVTAEQPYLVHALARHGIVVRTGDGGVRTVRPRLLRSAFELHAAGVQADTSLQVLIEVLDRVRLFAGELLRTTSLRVAPELDSAAVAQGLTGLLTEAFRVAVEDSARRSVVELLARDEVGVPVLDAAGADSG
ncbi:MAG TPA: MerR family transcriptional regulator [Rugosimonospora sp.]|nr:MerR family transcriptional regulator [Rugosimonospora sp.]